MYGINAKEMVMFMAQSVDIFQKSKLLTLAFELNIDKWDTMSETVKAAVSSGWQSIKYLNEEGTGVNSEIAQIPNDCGGIYIFYSSQIRFHNYIDILCILVVPEERVILVFVKDVLDISTILVPK